MVVGVSCSHLQTTAPSDPYSLILYTQIAASLVTAQNELTLVLE